MDKKALSERDICTKFIAPAIAAAGWDIQHQVREEVSHDPEVLLADYRQMQAEIADLQAQLKAAPAGALEADR